jgi:hypothetical protein
MQKQRQLFPAGIRVLYCVARSGLAAAAGLDKAAVAAEGVVFHGDDRN